MRHKFEYLRPKTIGEAIEMKAHYGHKAVYLAGGTDLLLQWQNGATNFTHCVDITFITELRYLERTQKEIRIGAMATLSDLEDSGEDDNFLASFSNTARLMCTRQMRNYASVGGNLCNASPAADLSVLFIGLGAEVVIRGHSGERNCNVEDFFTGVNQTILKEDEMLVEVHVPVPAQKVGSSFKRAGKTIVDIAQASAASSIFLGPNGEVEDSRIALGAVAPVALRARTGEKALKGARLSDLTNGLLDEVGSQAVLDSRPITDVRASADYRKYISKVLVKRSLQDAVQVIQGVSS